MRVLGRLLLSHHHDDQADRCTVVGGHRICRRCLILYPIAFGVMGLALAGLRMPVLVMVGLPIPMTLEFVAEHFLDAPYRAGRQVLLTAIGAPALGVGFARVVVDPTDHWFWVMVFAHGLPCGFAGLVATRRATVRSERARVATEELHPLLLGFDSAADFRAYLDESEERLAD